MIAIFTALIVDDETIVRQFLNKLLTDIDGINQIFEASNAQEAVSLARSENPQIVLIDIELGDGQVNGLDLARLIYGFSKKTYFIFVTGYSHYAIDAFDVRPFGYVLKPVNIERLTMMIMEIIQQLSQLSRGTEFENEVVCFKTSDEIVHINKADILFMEKMNGKTTIHTKKGRFYVRKNLDEIETLLGEEFMRVHRSFLVNLKEIKSSRKLLNRTYEIEFRNYSDKALMSRYHYQKYINSIKMP